MRKNKILIVDDDREILDFLKEFLGEHEFEVFTSTHGRDILVQIDANQIDLLLVDLRLDGESGLEISKEVFSNKGIPILMISGIKDDIEKIVGLEAGVDDFIEKPFNPRLLLAKIRATLRRTVSVPRGEEPPAEVIESSTSYGFGEFRLDIRRCTLLQEGVGYIELTNTEFRLLELLVSHPGTIFSRQELLETLGLESTTYMMRSVDVLVLRVRRKIEVNPSRPKYLQTRRNRGYIFCLDNELDQAD